MAVILDPSLREYAPISTAGPRPSPQQSSDQMSFKKVAVIGAGTMGAGIAGQVANAGVDVLLMDLKSDGDNPNAVAERGFKRLLDPDAPGLMDKAAGERIELGNIDDDFHKLADCDWIAEAVVERLDIKKALYQRLNDTCDSGTIVTSNTSTIPIRLLVEDMPAEFQQRFAITHFFNPVRFMRLLELVRGEHTDPAVMDTLDAFCEQKLGKGVVRCLDTPGFLGNRVGVYAIQCALHTAMEMGLRAGDADAIFGRPMGIPKTGVFGLYDLIGIDLMADVVKSLVSILPDGDAFHDVSGEIPLMTAMIANDQTGNKQGRGFYRQDEESGERFVLDRDSGEYLPFERPVIAVADEAEKNGVAILLRDNSVYGEFAWQVLSRTLCYAASLIPEVGDDPVGIDDAMKLGYNWIQGPFEMMDAIGIDYMIERLEGEGRAVPAFLEGRRGSTFYRVETGTLESASTDGWQAISRPDGVVRFNEKRLGLTAENSNEMASWFVSEDTAVVEFHSKANALDAESMAILADAIDQVPGRGLKGLLVHNDAQHFSCGVNLGAVREFYEREDFDGLDAFLDDFQRTVIAMRDAPYPVVVAPVGLSLGGGFEVVLHGKQVICHANSVMGLVESLVGVVPSGGGCKEMLYRWKDKLGCDGDITEASWKAFMNTGYGKTATSPLLAEKLAMVRPNDSYQMNRDRIYAAGIAAVDSGAGQESFHRPDLAMPGSPEFQKMVDWLVKARDDGILTPHDVVTGTEIARIMSGGEIDAGTVWSEQDLLDAERRSFLTLTATEGTQARIASMLDLGRTLRN